MYNQNHTLRRGQHQYNENAYFFHTIGIESNNVGAALYELGEHSTAIELYKNAVKAMMVADDENESDCVIDIHRTLIDKIIQGKEKLHNVKETAMGSFTQTMTRSNQLDIYQVVFSGSYHDRGPQWLREALMIDFPSSSSKKIDHFKAREDSAIALYNMGLIHHTTSSFDVAIRMFQMAKSTLPRSSKSLVLIAISNNIGQIHHKRGNIYVAMDNFKMALDLGRKIMLQRDISENEKKRIHNYMGTILSNVGRIHFESGQFGKALNMGAEALTTRKIAHGNGHIDVITTLFNLGLVQYRLGKFEEALEMYHQFLSHVMSMSTNVALLSSQDAMIDLAVSLNCIGKTFEQFTMISEAMDCYSLAFRLGGEYISSNRIFADILLNIGMIHFQTNTYDKALTALENSINLLRLSTGDDLEVAAMLQNIGIIQVEAGLVTEAMQSFIESYNLRRVVLGSDDYRVADSLYQIGRIFQEMGEYSKALLVLQETLRVERISLGNKHIDVAVTLFRISQIDYQRGNLNKSLQVLSEALSIAWSKKCQAGNFVANILSMMGDIYRERGNARKAMLYFTKAARITSRGELTINQSSLNSTTMNAFHSSYTKNGFYTAAAA